MSAPDHAWCVCSVVGSPSCNWYQLLFSGNKELRSFLRLVAGVVSLRTRERYGAGSRVFRIGSGAVDLEAEKFSSSYERDVGAGAKGQHARNV